MGMEAGLDGADTWGQRKRNTEEGECVHLRGGAQLQRRVVPSGGGQATRRSGEALSTPVPSTTCHNAIDTSKKATLSANDDTAN